MPQPIQRGLFIYCPKSGKMIGLAPRYWMLKWAMPAIGLAALAWYLIRVIPKPSRASYPCQQTAAPIAFGFLASFATAVIAFRKAKGYASQARFTLALLCGTLAAIAGTATLQYATSDHQANAAWQPSDKPNVPIGVARGINPGRVVWAYDPASVKWDGRAGTWWDEKATDQAHLDAMLLSSLENLTSAKGDAAAWTALFTTNNKARGLTGSYTKGQKIVMKINQNNGVDTFKDNGGRGPLAINGNPHLILATVKSLVKAGVAEEDIIVYDISRFITDSCCYLTRKEFPKVRWVQKDKGGEGREAFPGGWQNGVMKYSDPGRGLGDGLPKIVCDAAYMINMSIMKQHGAQGPTLLFKNHFGTVRDLNHGAISPGRMGETNPLVDVMASKYVGEKTVLFMIDSLYGADGPDNAPVKWKSAPFNGNFPASVFVSQDPVAIESVGFDFVNAEWGCWANTDNLMHEAALANNPPSGHKYAAASLGVHEHWNNDKDKKYSGAGKGIDLVQLQPGAK